MKNLLIENLTSNIDKAAQEFKQALLEEGYSVDDVKEQLITIIEDILNA